MPREGGIDGGWRGKDGVLLVKVRRVRLCGRRRWWWFRHGDMTRSSCGRGSTQGWYIVSSKQQLYCKVPFIVVSCCVLAVRYAVRSSVSTYGE